MTCTFMMAIPRFDRLIYYFTLTPTTYLYFCVNKTLFDLQLKRLFFCFRKMPKITQRKNQSDFKLLPCTIKGCKNKIKSYICSDGLLLSCASLCRTCSEGSTGICIKKYKAQDLLPDVSQFKSMGKKISSATLSKFDGSLMSNGRHAVKQVNNSI